MRPWKINTQLRDVQDAATTPRAAEFGWCRWCARLAGTVRSAALGGVGASQRLLPAEFRFFDVKGVREMQILPVQTGPE